MNGIILQKGQVFKSHCCGDFEILEETTDNSIILPYNTQKFKIRFLKTNTIKESAWQDIRRGNVWDYEAKTICGVACMGEGKYTSKNSKYYLRWKAIVHRCFDEKDIKYKSYGGKGVTICREWLNYQNFAEWFYNNDNYNSKDDFAIDKDILSKINNLDNKIYSPKTCLLIPHELNGFLAGDSPTSGVYKKGNKYYSILSHKGKRQFLGNFNRFSEAKDVYIKYKYEIWCELINNLNITDKLKDILLQYNFRWN